MVAEEQEHISDRKDITGGKAQSQDQLTFPQELQP